MIPFRRADTLLIGVSRYDTIREQRASCIIVRLFHFYVDFLHMHAASRTPAGVNVPTVRKLYSEDKLMAPACSANDTFRAGPRRRAIIHGETSSSWYGHPLFYSMRLFIN